MSANDRRPSFGASSRTACLRDRLAIAGLASGLMAATTLPAAAPIGFSRFGAANGKAESALITDQGERDLSRILFPNGFSQNRRLEMQKREAAFVLHAAPASVRYDVPQEFQTVASWNFPLIDVANADATS